MIERTHSSHRFPIWRRIHLASTGALCILAAVHSALTVRLYQSWSPDAVWFLGTGLGLLLLGLLNWSHVGLGPCQQPTARFVRWVNWAYFVFGMGALIAIPEPQALVITVALLVQAVAARWTLPGT